ncbi:MAG: hypothetical protein WBP63_01330, partial [Silvibacterium sp.]
MRHLSICLSLLAAVTPAALPAQIITFQPKLQSVSSPYLPTSGPVRVYLTGDFEGKHVTDLVVEYPPTSPHQYVFERG